MLKKNSSHFQSFTGFRQDNERRARRKRLFIIGAAFVLLIALFRSPVEGVLAEGFHYVAQPLYSVGSYLSDSFLGVRAYVVSKRSLMAENVRLQDAIELLSAEAYSRAILANENIELKAVLGRHGDRSLMLARVLASPGRAPYDTLIIDVGERDGVIVGTPVLADGDFVVGEVSQVFARSAVATLYSSSGNELPVTIGSSSVPTIAYGVGGGNFRVILPKGIIVTEGDLIEIPALAPTFLGVVSAIHKQEGGSLQEIYFKWPMNVFTLRFVYLAIPVIGEEAPLQ